MTYGGPRPLTAWQMIALVVYWFVGLILLLIALAIALLGGCPAFAAPTCEPANKWFLIAIFPVTLIAVASGHILLKAFYRKASE